MITVAQKLRQLQSLEASLPEKFVELAEDYGNTSVALVKEESIEKGINKDGQSGNKVNYSSKPVRSSSLMDAALNASGRSYLKNQPTATYYGLRQAQGMTSPTVNLSYTGVMWQGFRLVSVTATGTGASIRIGATGQHAQVFVANIKRYGAFYKATPEQQQRLRDNMHLTTRRWFSNE